MIKAFIKKTLQLACKLLLNLHSPYYIIMVDGGLGSQIFKYALGTAIHEKTNATIYYDLSWFSKNGMDINNKFSRKFEICNVFPSVQMNPPSKLLLTLTYFSNCYSTKYPHIFDNDIFSKRNIYLDSYFANINYFYLARNTLIKNLLFSNIYLKYKLSEHKNSIAVHIRQGDYINSVHDVVTPKYFINAMNYFINAFDNCYFYIFCTSPDYFTKHLSKSLPKNLKYEIITGSDEDGSIDMYRMSECRHFIISNSSFSLFPAWLNKHNGTVIMPSKWHSNMDSDMTKDSDKAFLLENAIVMEV